VARHGAVGHLEADQLAARPRGAHLLDRVAADEVALAGLDDPAESGLQGVRRLIDVVAVERVAHLEPQRVARAEPDGTAPAPRPACNSADQRRGVSAAPA